ncbi:hypothetical protein [Carboxylicivirga sp. M1479]|uniref:hypothetical protein n=1 Tax=Carboxylicivirga sp. M1479 TaxID=2594476 RepID=UPI0011779DA0|nr:hypothetical protein [Carboxylicivirga sp. M1479]TRX72181.1 hypothetical protein FNN09_02070 [Carboxylicivirga sp. M1479]
MQRNYLLVMLAILLAGCVGDAFNTEKLSGEVEWETGLAVPLIKASVSMGDVFSENTDYVKYYMDEDGNERIMLYQDQDSVSRIGLNDLFVVNGETTSIPVPFSLLNNGAEHSIDVNIPFNVQNGVLSSIQVDYELRVEGSDMAAPLSLQISMPSVNADQGGKIIDVLVDNNQPVIQLHEDDVIDLVDGSIPAVFTFKTNDNNLWFDMYQVGNVSLSMDQIHFDSAKGRLQEIVTRFDEGILDFDFDIFEELPEGVEFVKPNLKLLITNSTPFRGLIRPEFIAQGGAVDGMALNVSEDIIVQQMEDGKVLYDTISLSDRSNLNEFFSNVPDQIAYSADLVLNPNNAVTEEVELDETSNVHFGYMIEVPAEFLVNAEFDTETVDLNDNDFIRDFENAQIDINGISNFPLQAEAFIDFYEESSDQVTETIHAIVLNAAEVNEKGIVVNEVTRTERIKLTPDQIEKLAVADQLRIRFKLQSANYESGQPVVLLTDNSLAVDFSIKGQIKN